MELIKVIYGFCGVLMFGLILDWIDSKALKVDSRPGRAIDYPSPRWFLWAKFHTVDRATGQEYYFYMLMIRLPSYAWAYRISVDDFGWMQNAVVWRSRKTHQYAPPKGFSIQRVEPLARK